MFLRKGAASQFHPHLGTLAMNDLLIFLWDVPALSGTMNQPNNLRSAQCKERIDTGVCPVPFTHCTSVKQPCLVPCNAPLLKIWVKVCFLRFSAIRTLRIKIPSKHPYIPRPLNHQARISAVLGLQQDLGALAKLFRLPSNEIEVWFWEALKGQTLKWSGK